MPTKPTKRTVIVIVAVLVLGLGLTAGTMALLGSSSTPAGGAKRQATTPPPSSRGLRGRSPRVTVACPVAKPRSGWQSRLTLDPSLSADNASTARVIDKAAGTAKWTQLAHTIQSDTPPPPPQASAAFPPIPASRRSLSAGAYARSFTRELLDVDFASESRSQLLSWANLNTAAVPLAPIPANYARLYPIDQLRSAGGPVPSSAMWSQLAGEHVVWRVSGVTTRYRSVWETTVSAGFVPPDPRMEMLVATGTLTVTQPGHAPRTEQVSLDITTATGLYETGYGVANPDHWSVTS